MTRPGLVAVTLSALFLLPGSAVAQDVSPASQPSTPDLRPNAERPLSHEELLALRAESRSRGWDGRMLVADTVIERTEPTRIKADGNGAGVAFGHLARDSKAGDPVVQARDRVGTQYPNDQSPVAGLLGIELSDRALGLQGTLVTPAGTYLTPVELESMNTAAQVPVGSLVAVRGWLSRIDQLEPCPRVPEALDRDGNGGWSSPFVRCPGGWITADAIGDIDSSDPLAPAAYGIPVQHGAATQFGARRAGAAISEPATYLLRHVANPLEGGQPALGWEVIGRLDAVDTTRLETSAALSEAAAPSGLAWQAGLERQPPADAQSTHSTAWANGFAAVHIGQHRVLSAWVSPDGRTWDGAPLPPDIGSVSALLRLGDRLAIISNEQPFSRTWRFDVWTSRDGLDWTRSTRQRVRWPRGVDNQARRRVHGYWSVGDRIVAIGSYGPNRCCGRIDERIFLAAPGATSDVTFTWSSTDGRTWRRQRTMGVPRSASDELGSRISSDGRELLAIWGDHKRTISTSADGVRWHPIGRYPDDLEIDSRSVLARTPDGLVIAGEPQEGGTGEGSPLAIWTSRADGGWQRYLDRPSSAPESITVVGDSVVVAGSQLDLREPSLDPPPDRPWLLVSMDRGRTWDDSLAWTGDSDWCLRELSDRNGHVVLHASCAPPGAASKYIVDLGAVNLAAAPVVPPPQALQCDRRTVGASVRDEWGYLSGFTSPVQALDDVLAEGFVVPRSDYDVLARDDAAVLYGFRNGREVKVAVRVTATDAGGWAPEWLAHCDLSEFGRKADMGPGVWLWANRNGRTIQERRGPAHCRLQSTRTLWWPAPSGKQRRAALYVRDPEGQFRDQWQAPYLRSTTLPASARDTSYRRHGATIWMAADRSSIYIKEGKRVERWPRIPRSAIACA